MRSNACSTGRADEAWQRQTSKRRAREEAWKEEVALGCEMGSMFGMSWWMWFPGLLAVGALIAFGVWAVERSSRRPGGALRILQERLARGEIDAEEFERRRATLEGSTWGCGLRRSWSYLLASR